MGDGRADQYRSAVYSRDLVCAVGAWSGHGREAQSVVASGSSDPLVTARYGGALMWLATISILAQGLYNIEISRYTLYTGEPIFTGKFRTLPRTDGLAARLSAA